MTDTLLVVGATGVVGNGAMAAFAEAGGHVIGVSRRAPHPALDLRSDYPADQVRYQSLDLLDAQVVRAAAPKFSEVTHLVYAALFEKPGLLAGWVEADQMRTNQQMLENLLQPLIEHAPKLRHISLLQGTKAYGAHLHAIDIPARESSPRDAHDNFYWLQEDYLKSVVAGAGERLCYTIVRPQVVYGRALGSAMNLIPVLGVYGALLKTAGEPLHFPGAAMEPGRETIQEAVDADLLGRMLCWAAHAPAARDQVFNITNGDVYVWRHLWPDIAQAMGMAMGEQRPLSLAQWLPEQAPRWQHIQQALQLSPIALPSLLGESHYYADALLGVHSKRPAPSALVSTIKLRQAGFAECVDTAGMFGRLFADLQQRGILPSRQWDGGL